MIVCATPNPALDRTLIVPRFHVRDVSRASDVITAPGGKGLNVARVVKQLGSQPVCTGFLGGHIGRLFAELAEHEGLPADWTWTGVETRLATIIATGDGHDASVINESGPHISAADWQDFEQRVLRNFGHAGALTLSGSVPPGPSPADYAQLLRLSVAAQGERKNVWADTSGEWLLAAAEVPGVNIKVNAIEAATLAPDAHPINTLSDAASLAQELVRERNVRRAIITLGGKGAVLAHADGAWVAEAPRIQVISTVGSGDAFLGAMALAIEQGLADDEALRQAVAAGAANALCFGGGRFAQADFDRVLSEVRFFAAE